MESMQEELAKQSKLNKKLKSAKEDTKVAKRNKENKKSHNNNAP